MEPLMKARELSAAGRFADALGVLNQVSASHPDRVSVTILRAELLERTGHYSQSRSTVESVLKNNRLTEREKSACELILGLILIQSDAALASEHFQKAVVLAKKSGDYRSDMLASLAFDVRGR